jgi:acetyl-CoA acetyltransferase
MFRRHTLQAVYILSAVRTPICKIGGSMSSVNAADMGVVEAKAEVDAACRRKYRHSR